MKKYHRDTHLLNAFIETYIWIWKPRLGSLHDYSIHFLAFKDLLEYMPLGFHSVACGHKIDDVA